MPSLQLRLRSVRKSPPELRVATSRLESMSPHHQASVFPYTVDDRAQANPQFQSTHSLGEKGRGKGWEHLCTCLKMFQLRILERKIGLGLNFCGDISLVNNIKKKRLCLGQQKFYHENQVSKSNTCLLVYGKQWLQERRNTFFEDKWSFGLDGS